MDKLDFTVLTTESGYDAAAALTFFESAGKTDNIAAGKIIFAEDEKGNWLFLQRNKMYLLLEGEVNLFSNNRLMGTVRKGEIFGEMAFFNQALRSATATAKTECSLITLDDKQFRAALRKNPEFALVLMSTMVDRLRKIIDRTGVPKVPRNDDEWKETRAFDKKLLADLVDELGDASRIRYNSGKVIIEEGQPGVRMYVVLEGRVAVYIQNRIVEKVGPGGIFGEMALVGHSQRLASAIADTDCSLLAINRNVFLSLVEENPEFGVSVLSTVSERARSMTSRQS